MAVIKFQDVQRVIEYSLEKLPNKAAGDIVQNYTDKSIRDANPIMG